MKYGNCLFYSIYRFLKNRGGRIIPVFKRTSFFGVSFYYTADDIDFVEIYAMPKPYKRGIQRIPIIFKGEVLIIPKDTFVRLYHLKQLQ